MKVLFTYDYGQEKMKAIEALGYDIVYVHESEIENNEAVNDVEILACYNPFSTLRVDQMHNLKWIQLSSIGFDQLPVETVIKNNIEVTNNRGGYSKPMGEWIVMNLLEIFKHRKRFYADQMEKRWALNSSILEVVGKKIAFLGTGTIAQEAAKRLQGFEAEIIGFNTSGHETRYFNNCYALSELNEKLHELDAVIVTLPHTESTHHIINKEVMDLMKDDSILINVSRGGNLDEEALIDALKRDKFLGVAVDVFESEPLAKDSPLWDFERVYFSPHNSWISEMKNERRYSMIYENLKRYKEGKSLNNIVNIERGY